MNAIKIIEDLVYRIEVSDRLDEVLQSQEFKYARDITDALQNLENRAEELRQKLVENVNGDGHSIMFYTNKIEEIQRAMNAIKTR